MDEHPSKRPRRDPASAADPMAFAIIFLWLLFLRLLELSAASALDFLLAATTTATSLPPASLTPPGAPPQTPPHPQYFSYTPPGTPPRTPREEADNDDRDDLDDRDDDPAQ